MKYVSLFIFIIFVSCGPDRENTKRAGFKIVEEFSFATDGLTNINPGITQLLETDSGSYLFIYNRFAKRFQFLDFPSGKLVKDIPMNLSGPNSVQGFTGGTVTNQDSIWITISPPGLLLMDYNGDILLKKPIPDGLFPVSSVGVNARKPLIQHGGKIFGAQPFFMNHHGMDKSDILKHQLVYSYDFLNDTVAWYNVFYSEDYWDKGKKLTRFSWAEREGKIYIAPWYDHEMQVFDLSSLSVVDRKQVKSSQINKFDYVNEFPSGGNEGMINNIKYDRYGFLLYDKYREVFYRIFLPGVELEEDFPMDKLSQLNNSKSYTGIMILDKDLNILGEHIFDKFEVHSDFNFLVGEKGLYVSQNNLNHPEYDEDRFRYLLLELEYEN